MKRELRCACHGDVIGYEITPGEDHAQPVNEPPRFVGLRTVMEGPLEGSPKGPTGDSRLMGS